MPIPHLGRQQLSRLGTVLIAITANRCPPLKFYVAQAAAATVGRLSNNKCNSISPNLGSSKISAWFVDKYRTASHVISYLSWSSHEGATVAVVVDDDDRSSCETFVMHASCTIQPVQLSLVLSSLDAFLKSVSAAVESLMAFLTRIACPGCVVLSW